MQWESFEWVLFLTVCLGFWLDIDFSMVMIWQIAVHMNSRYMERSRIFSCYTDSVSVTACVVCQVIMQLVVVICSEQMILISQIPEGIKVLFYALTL